MKIRTKLILNYSSLSFILLLLFSLLVLALYVKFRQHDFVNRLRNRAASSVNLLFEENRIDSSMLRLIDRNIVTSMSQFHLLVYDENNRLYYSNADQDKGLDYYRSRKMRHPVVDFLTLGRSSIDYPYLYKGKQFTVIASGYDNQGITEFMNLLRILLWVIFLSLLIIAGFGFYNAVWSLRPFRQIIKEVEAIEPGELKRRLTVSGSDEISQLSKSFNILLDRISSAFETEKSFIANASHELRTPVTSVLGQVEVALNKDRSKEEYKSLLESVYEDTNQMANIINGFLELAEANLDSRKVEMKPVGIDDLLFSIIEEFKRRKPYYNILLEFARDPESDSQIQCIGSERLLGLMFSNIIDNACKYSDDKKAKVQIDFNDTAVIANVTDWGIGIPEEELEHIFKPLYRAYNVSGKSGHGIGLTIVKRVADLHHARVFIRSELNVGTTVTVSIPSIHK